MLAALMLVAAHGPLPACPPLPTDALTTPSRVCDVLEVSGKIDASEVTVDPAFQDRVAEREMARPASGIATLTAYDRNGQAVFSFPFNADGAFRLVLPVAPIYMSAIVRLTLTANGGTFDRGTSSAGAAPHAADPYVNSAISDAPAAEAVEADEGHVVFAWNAREYPGVRLLDARSGAEIAAFAGSQTYEQVSVKTNATRLLVSFSDGIHSVTRSVRVVGRR